MKMYSDPVTGEMWLRGWVGAQLYSSMTAALAVCPGVALPAGKNRYYFFRGLSRP